MTAKGPKGPLRKIVRTRDDGKVMRRTRDGQQYRAAGYEEVLECGHVFVPYDNHRFGGQDELKFVGERRRCLECAPRK